MGALAELFDETRLLVPTRSLGPGAGEIPLSGPRLKVVPLTPRSGSGLPSKLSFLPWLFRNMGTIVRQVRWADAIHAPVPGDVGTAGILLAWALRKPLFVRHCGNWMNPVTVAEKFWRWLMEATAGGRNVMLATGGTGEPPSSKNPNVHWIFASSLTKAELKLYSSRRSYPSRVPIRLIIVARQEESKGAGTIVQALPLLAQRFPGIGLNVVGEGSAIPGFKQLARELGVADRVQFSGKLNHKQVMQRLREAHMFVFPTTSSDGFPKAVLEGLASGLPVVATRVSVLPRLLGSGCGVLMDDATPEALARGIEQALTDARFYEDMSVNAIETARQFSLEAWCDTIGQRLEAAWGKLKSQDEGRELMPELGQSADNSPVLQ